MNENRVSRKIIGVRFGIRRDPSTVISTASPSDLSSGIGSAVVQRVGDILGQQPSISSGFDQSNVIQATPTARLAGVREWWQKNEVPAG